MKILLVEDDDNKRIKLAQWVTENHPGATLDEAKSFSSGLNAALFGTPDIVLLDMQMPTFDKTPREEGGRKRYFAGKDIMRRLKKDSVNTKVIVVTQFISFGQGSEEMSLDALNETLQAEFSDLYIGTVYFRGSETKWQAELHDYVKLAREGSNG